MAVLVFKIKNKTLPAQFYNYINEVCYITKKSLEQTLRKIILNLFSKKQNHKNR